MSNLHSNKNVKTITVPHFLFGGFNPFEKEKSQNGGSSPNRGVNKTWLKTITYCCFCLGPTLPICHDLPRIAFGPKVTVV